VQEHGGGILDDLALKLSSDINGWAAFGVDFVLSAPL
jgi:hypothetical protein